MKVCVWLAVNTFLWAQGAPPALEQRPPFAEKEVTVGSGEWVLPGTLTMPAGSGPFPAVVLVHDFGPSDRDGSAGPNKPLRDLAWGLAEQGVAVLRYDKRTRRYGAQLSTASTLTVQQEVEEDALAAVDLLRHTAGVEEKRLFLAGHGLGGYLLPRLGERDPRLAGLILLAAPARPLPEVILAQHESTVAQQQLDPISEQRELLPVRQTAWRIKHGTLPATARPDEGFGYPGTYWISLRDYDAPATARALPQPLLLLQGQRDLQVTSQDENLWRSTLKSRPQVTFRSYPRLNHLFLEGEGKGVAEYQRPGQVAREVVTDMARWILQTRVLK